MYYLFSENPPHFNPIGLVIKKYRLEQNMSQETLCHGICVVSYLSKIESGLVAPSDEILAQLCQALKITYYCDPEFIKQGYSYFKDFFHTYTFCNEQANQEISSLIEVDSKKYIYSPLLIDYLIFKAYSTLHIHDEECLGILQELELYKKALDREQLYKFYLCLGLLQIHHLKLSTEGLSSLTYAVSIHKSSFSLSSLANGHYLLGDYAISIDLNQEVFSLAIAEGNLSLAIQACCSIADAYANIRNMHLMVKYYEQALNLVENSNNLSLKSIIYYNLGSTYIMFNEFDLALSYCLKSLQINESIHKQHLFLYHKLAIIYHHFNQFKEASFYLDKAYETLDTLPSSDIEYIRSILDIVALRLTRADYIKNEQYIHLLESVYTTIQEKFHFGFKLFHGGYLIECYKANRRYKEALQVTEELYVNNSFFSNRSFLTLLKD